jgi:tyrosine-protein kinase Etk/Wzc
MEDREFNWADILDTLYFQRTLIAVVTGVFTVMGAVYAITAPPIYQADLLIQIEGSSDAASKAAMGELSGLFQGKSEAAAEIEILRSRLVASRTVDNLHLDFEARPRYFPILGAWLAKHNHSLSQPGLFGFGGYAWGSEVIELAQFDVPADLEEVTLNLVADEGGRFTIEGDDRYATAHGKVGEPLKIPAGDEAIALRLDKLSANPKTRFIIRHHSHLNSVQWLQSQLGIAEKVRQSGILSVKLEGKDPKLITNVLNEVGTQYVFQNMERKSAEAEKTLQFLDQFLPDLKTTLDEAESRYISVSNAHGTVDVVEEIKLILKRLADAKNRASELSVKRNELLNRLTPAHPSVQAIDAQISGMQSEISRITAEIGKLPGLEREVFGLSRDVKINAELYANLLKTAQQLRLFKAGKVGNVRIIDDAVVPEVPIKPKRLVVLTLFMLVGVGLGVATAFIRKLMFGGLEHAHEIEEHTGLSVFASIPQSVRQVALYEKLQAKAPGQFVLERIDADDAAIEGLRSLRTALQFSMQDARNNLILISGPTPGLGKSFVSVNKAAVLAASGKHVLLIDLDLRKGYLNQYLGLPRENGMAELLVNTRTFDQVVHRNILPNLDFVPTGVLPSAPHLLLSSDNMKRFLEKVSIEYDLVILDTPPVLAVTDASVLSEHVGITILVTREGVTTLGDLNETVKRLARNGTKVTGVVFNAVRSRPGKYGSTYGTYRYTSEAYQQYTKKS